MNLSNNRQTLWRYVPAIILGVVLYVLWKGLYVNHEADKTQAVPFPTFSLNDIVHPDKNVTTDNLKNQVSIVHVWASWCGICVKEHDEWVRIKQKWDIPLVGVIYRDDASKIKEILNKKGDPYQFVLDDKSGSLGLDLGLVGTPETFIVDNKGVIRYHHLGPVKLSQFENDFLPIIEKLKNEQV